MTTPSASGIRIEPFTWLFGKRYLQANAECPERPLLQLDFLVTILESERLVAVISGPAAVPKGDDFTLESKAYDPEAPDFEQVLEYDWTCRGACDLNSSTAALQVPGGQKTCRQDKRNFRVISIG